MSTTATASLSNDISFTLTQLGSNNQNESASLAYSRSLSNGTGNLQINYGVVSSGTLPSGGKQYFDLQNLSKSVFGTSASIQFSKVKSIIVENRETTLGKDINIYSTGVSAFTEPFNGGSGNLLIKPYAAWNYSDPILGATVDGSNNEFTIEDVSGSGSLWTMIVVGVTG